MTDKPKITNKFAIQTKVKTEYTISIWDELEEYEHYADLIETLYKASSTDKVKLKISTPGGRCSVGFNIIDRIQSLECRVDIEVPYPTYSMGAIMALSGDSLYIKPGGFLMFHDYSTGMKGKGNEIFKSTEAYRESFECRFKLICQPFLTKKECVEVLNGKDLYIKWNQVDLKERIRRHFK